jgi:hypothetical protein
MSKGNQIVPVRMSCQLKGEIDDAVGSRNAVSPEAPMTVSDWIRAACQEKIDHLKRSRKAAENRKAQRHAEYAIEEAQRRRDMADMMNTFPRPIGIED